MLRLVPLGPHGPLGPDLPPKQPSPATHCQTDRPVTEDYLVQSTAFGTATGAFETLMDWVEGRP